MEKNKPYTYTHTLYLGPAIVRINLFVRSIATISDIKMVSGDDVTDVLVQPNCMPLC